MSTIKIAVDGPAGAGKTTISKSIAKRLGFLHVDTGAIYRAVALKVQKMNPNLNDTDAAEEFMRNTYIDIKHDENNEQHIILDGYDATGFIRTPEITQLASDISANPSVRGGLIDLQRDIAQKYNVILDGRDIGSVVLPHANIKFFLTATLEERAVRRYNEQKINHMDCTLEEIKLAIKRRDRNDSTRASAPLMLVPDAIVIDTTDIPLGQSIDLIEKIIRENLDV